MLSIGLSVLSNRKQRVVVNGSVSEFVSINKGVPQGTVLGPMLLSIIVNDIRPVYPAHGDYGMACVDRSLQVKYVNPITGVVFIACGRDYYRMVWSALTFIRTITVEDSARPCMFRVLHVGGTLLSCQKFLIHHNKEELFKLLQQCKIPAERRKISKTLKKAEKHTLPLNPFNTKKRRTSTTLDVPPDEDFDSN